MLRRLAPALLTLSAVVLALPATSSADPGTPGCVTRGEYAKARKGMTQASVHGIFGTTGKRVSRAVSGGYVAEVRSYTVCGSQFSTIAISFSANPGRALTLGAKSAVWVD